MGFILFVGVAAGFLASLVATALLARRLVGSQMPPGPEAAAQRRTVARGAVAGALIAFLPALLLATVVGATLGVMYGGALAESPGGRDSGALLGAALGVFAVATILLCGSTWLGAWVGRRLAARDVEG